MDVSIIIVNYNTKKLLADCLRSIYEQTKDIAFEVIVSDNGSTDGSVEMVREAFPQVILIENKANLGFGAANNRALAVAKGAYLFYLNSDTVLLNNAVKQFYDWWQTHDDGTLGALGANLLNANGEVIHSYGSFLCYKTELKNTLRALRATAVYTVLSVFSKRFPPPDVQDDRTAFFAGEVDYITGADLFVKNDSAARFDERFFMYCEEADLQLQLAQKGKTRLIIDGPKIIHLSGGGNKRSVDKVRSLATFSSIHFNLSRVQYFKKNGISAPKVALLKYLTFMQWLNPLIFKTTKRFIPQLLRI